MMRKAVYPGTFDPVTNGHIDVIRRGSLLFDKLIVSVGCNPSKASLFAVEDRMEMIRENTKDLKNVTVDSFSGMLVDYLREQKTNVILRGIRTISDFESEYQRALTNRALNKEVETVFVTASEQFSFLNSSLIKEIVSLGGQVSQFVPSNVERQLIRKYKHIYEKNGS